MHELPNSDSNKRDAFRCPCPDPRDAKLTVSLGKSKQVTYDVVVVDESMGGFAVVISDEANLGPSRRGLLTDLKKEVICEIMNQRRISEGKIRLV